MKIRATIATLLRLSAVTAGLGGCTTAHSVGKLTVDSPALPYQAPDISDITGIEEPDEGEGSGSAAPEPGK